MSEKGSSEKGSSEKNCVKRETHVLKLNSVVNLYFQVELEQSELRHNRKQEETGRSTFLFRDVCNNYLGPSPCNCPL